MSLQDYFDIVKNPMDLSTIKRKLDTGQYQEPWQYVDDVWLMFNNAWLYNRKTSRVYKFCTKLAEVFEQEIDPVMQSLGYCCGRKVGIPVSRGVFFPTAQLQSADKAAALCVVVWFFFLNRNTEWKGCEKLGFIRNMFRAKKVDSISALLLLLLYFSPLEDIFFSHK